MDAPTIDPQSNVPAFRWMPAPGVVNHAGAPLEQDSVFFAEPPPAIGEVQSATTTMRLRHRPMDAGLRAFLVTSPFAALGVAWALGFVNGTPGPGTIHPLVPGLASVLLAIAIYAWTVFRRRCSFVGRDGIAECTLTGSPRARPRVRVFRFHEAESVRFRHRDHYQKGVYTGTIYAVDWRNSRGRTVKKFAGSVVFLRRGPAMTNNYWLAMSAERAWNERLVARAREELAQKGFIEFRLNARNDAVRVGRGYLEVVRKGSVRRIESSEMRSIRMDAVELEVTHRDARWYSRKGGLRFDLDKFPNAKVFSQAVRTLVRGAATTL